MVLTELPILFNMSFTEQAMQTELSIITNSDERITMIMAETTLDAPPYTEFPASFGGKLLNVPPDRILHFIKEGVQVLLMGRRYRFTKLEKDGNIEAEKDW
jgi:hypothetical protein